ncbi:MAG: riboflavin synthase [Desulfovibrionaceae bacterium]|nr:riboflavin synthase [Desulfovibrionaceae bacterium]
MFTGLIQGQGCILALHPQGKECRLSIRALFDLPHIVGGESIAVNGTCLSVEDFGMNQFSVYASAETMTRTSLASLSVGSLVNLERALAVGDRLGGHIVSGHVDCLATVHSIKEAGESCCITLKFPQQYAPEVIAKGSVTLDGVSLTVNTCGQDFLSVNVIPDTQKRTTIGQWKTGVLVNMETDVIGKYVRNMLQPWAAQSTAPSAITEQFLAEHGFF